MPTIRAKINISAFLAVALTIIFLAGCDTADAPSDDGPSNDSNYVLSLAEGQSLPAPFLSFTSEGILHDLVAQSGSLILNDDLTYENRLVVHTVERDSGQLVYIQNFLDRGSYTVSQGAITLSSGLIEGISSSGTVNSDGIVLSQDISYFDDTVTVYPSFLYSLSP